MRVLVKEMLRRGCSLSELAHRERGPTVDERSIEYGDVREQDHPHACWDGYVYLGYVGDDGEEQIEKLPCRRCAEEGE
jgi:hypothetical protein